MNIDKIAEELFEKLDDSIITFYPDYGYEWDKEEALNLIKSYIKKAMMTMEQEVK